jgi:phosphoribosylformimino-5-aminoimidazole carboxamide ribotide isomerase
VRSRRSFGGIGVSLRAEVVRDYQAGFARRGHSGEAVMLIPSVDLMGGKIVQLVQGEKKSLEVENFDECVKRFKKYPLVQVIDLDAAMGKGNNRALVAECCSKLRCQVGGGIRGSEDAKRVFRVGAKKVILGSSLIREGGVDVVFASRMSSEFGSERLVAAIDSRGGRVAIHGWKTTTEVAPAGMMRALEPYVDAFLYTHIETEGMLQGIPMGVVRGLKKLTPRRLIAAGGIRSQAEIDELDAMGVDAVVGMGIYTGLIEV